MNYDFNEKEFMFFIKIHELAEEIAGKVDFADPKTFGNAMREMLPRLSKTPYLSLGLEPVQGFSSMLAATAAVEAFAAIAPSLCLGVEMSTRVFGRVVARWGDDQHKDSYLKQVKAGKLIGALGVSEESVNVENEPLGTTGTGNGDAVVVNGRKQYVVNAGIADVIAVAGILDNRPALFLIDKKTPGLEIKEQVDPLGFDGLDMAGIILDDCKIAAQQVIFPPGNIDMLPMLRHWENQVICAVSLGLFKSCFKTAKNYAKSHRTGGKPIIAFQEIGFALAEMLTLYQTAQLLAYRAAWTDDDDPAKGPELTLCAKVFCTEGAERVAGQALRILGGHGHVTKNPAELALRSAKYCQVFGTSTEIARMKVGGAAMGYKFHRSK